MTERFSGRITLDEGDEVDVDLELSDAEVRLATESAEIGVWPRPDCQFVDAGDGVYQLMVDDDVVTFVPTEGESFGRALHGPNGTDPLERAPSDEDSSADESSEAIVADDDGGHPAGESADEVEDPIPPGGGDAGTDDNSGFFTAVEPVWGAEQSHDEDSAPGHDAFQSDGAVDQQVSVPSNPFIVEDEPWPSVEPSPLTGNLEEMSVDVEEPVEAPSPFFVGSEDQEGEDAFTAVPAASEAESQGDQVGPVATEDVDYDELASALEALADQQAVESSNVAVAEDPDVDGAGDSGDERQSERRGFGPFRSRLLKPAADIHPADEPEDAPADDVEVGADDDSRTKGWFVDPVTVAALSTLKQEDPLTPAEQAIAEAEGGSASVISTEDVIASQRSLRKSNVVRRLTWDLVRKVGAGVLLGVGLAVLVILFPDAWEVLTSDSEPPVVSEDPATSTTVDAAQATTTTQPILTTTTAAISTTTTTRALPDVRDSIFDLRGAEFFDRWNQAAVPVGQVLGFGVYPPPGAFENEFYPYLSMTGLVGEDGTLDGFSIVVDPTGPSDSDWLAIQALGVAIAVAEPDLTGSERADLLGTLGLNVRQPDLGGINGAVERGPYRYELVFDQETTLLTLTLSPAGTSLPGSESDG